MENSKPGKSQIRISSNVVAEIVGTTESNVVKVRKGIRGKGKRGKAAAIAYVDMRIDTIIKEHLPGLKRAIEPM